LTLPKRWIAYLLSLGLWLLAALLIGLVMRSAGWWVAGASGAWLAVTLLKLYDLDRVLDGGSSRSITATSGLWAQLLARVERYKDKASSRKKKYHRLLREVRESTGALRDAGVILNAQNEIQWFNAAATRLLGLESPRDVGLRIDNLVRHPEFVSHLDDADDGVICIPAPNEPAGRISVQVIPYSRKQRLAIFRDVTHEYRLERARRDFVANASHELRSPLTVFGGYLETMLGDPAVASGWRGPIDEMQRQVDRMAGIIRDLLELSRLESMDGKAGQDFIDVAAIATAIGNDFMGSTDPELHFDLAPDVALLGDEVQLHSVFYNLIVNAMRFTPENGRVQVTWQRTDRGASFEVRDTGIGIPDEMISRGTGLGLAIVKHALQKHDAELTIESRLDVGSTFGCHFPVERVVSRGGARQAAV
jgi:two-component system phosphate regulon sensor histidine kinase PhoR